MSRIFICYRRDDTAGHTGRLRDALSAEFGAAEIFRDLDTIAPGENFVQAMSAGIASCRVFLAIVGRQWLTSVDRNGRRRLDDPADHVRTELAHALERGVRVIPVLVQGASMPGAADLPDPLEPFADRNAIELDDAGWQADVSRLSEAIRRELQLPPASPRAGAGRRPLNWRMAAAAGAAALILAILVVAPRWPTTRSADSPTPSAVPPASGASPVRASGRSGPETQATLPAGGEAEVGEQVYELVSAGVSGDSGDRVLSLRVRLTNHARNDTNFGDGYFRLRIGEELHAPNSGLNEIVAGETAKDGVVTFPLPQGVARATLRITNRIETAEIPLDLTGRSGLTAAQDRELRRSGKRTFDVSIDAASSRMRFGELTCELRSASIHRYADKLTLTLNVRVHNGGRYDTNLSDGNFRLVLDGTARAPVSGVSTIVSGEGSRDAAIVFDLPLETGVVVLRARFGEKTVEIPLRLPPTA